MKGQPIGKCPTCSHQLRRTTHEAGTGKYLARGGGSRYEALR